MNIKTIRESCRGVREGKQMKVRIKNPILQLFCKHEPREFERPIDKKTNPYGFVPLCEDTIWVCTKCGKKL
jgi:hypothetical protein